jgi:hypothetical protein
MGVARRAGHHRPAPRPAELDRFEGRWVAVKAGHVIADAASSTELVAALRRLGDDGRGAVVQHVVAPSDAALVGLG